jgi:hypothetical protein
MFMSQFQKLRDKSETVRGRLWAMKEERLKSMELNVEHEVCCCQIEQYSTSTRTCVIRVFRLVYVLYDSLKGSITNILSD